MRAQYKDQVIVVRGRRPDPSRPTVLSVSAGGGEILTNKLGGSHPSPLELLLASLAGCVNVVGELVAKEMGIAIEDLEVEVSGVFNPSKLLTGSGERAGFKSVRARVRVKSSAPAESLAEWLRRTLDRCPIEDNLSNSTPVYAEVERL